MSYEFSGFDWTELAECWGITAEEGETIQVTILLGYEKHILESSDDEVVLAEKIKNFIYAKLEEGYEGGAQVLNPSIRKDMDNFLDALIEQSKDWDYSTTFYKGLLEIKDDHTFVQWFVKCLEGFWT